MEGIIYKITNDINNKVYIGQTIQPLNTRWRSHKVRGKNPSFNTGLYGATKKYGAENFDINIVISCDESELNEMEIYYIDKYDTYNNGYNRTIGGEGVSTLQLNPTEVLEKYKQLGNMKKVAEYFHCSSSTIWIILNNHAPRELIEYNKQRSAVTKREKTQLKSKLLN